MNQNAQEIIEEYLNFFPKEQRRLTGITERFPLGKSIVSRTDFIGHITVSALVFSPDKKNVLLIYHKQLQKFLQPGGHIEKFDASLFDACYRELREETGLQDIKSLDLTGRQIPIDIDIHSIPANKKKNEPEHFHYDFCFVFVAQSTEIQIQKEEVTDYKWTPLGEVTGNERLSNIFQKVNLLFDQKKPMIFFRSIIERPYQDVSFLVVTHLLKDRPFFLEALSSLGNIEGIIPKPNSINKEVLKAISDRFPILPLTKASLYDVNMLSPYIEKSKNRIVLLDIGGYFAPIINELKEQFPEKIIGVVEDTENGYQKYVALSSLNVPLFSVARSVLKENEDFLVGESVVFSTDAVLREYNILFDYLQCGVIGYGKIGKSITFNLQRRNIKPYVYDMRATREVEAVNNGCYVTSKKHLLEESGIIFCATGNESLSTNDFTSLKNGVFITSVTSSDDEMDLSSLEKIYAKQEVTTHITKYYNDNNYFYLVNKGNAVNFIHGAVVGSSIFLVQAEILLCVLELSQKKCHNGIQELHYEKRDDIAEKWLQVFNRTSEE